MKINTLSVEEAERLLYIYYILLCYIIDNDKEDIYNKGYVTGREQAEEYAKIDITEVYERGYENGLVKMCGNK